MKFHPRPRYKNGTSSQAFFVLPSLPCRALQSDRCVVITALSSLFAPFHGGNTGSNPAGDARSISYGENFYSLFKEMPGNHGFREYSATSRIHSATCHLQSAVETPCESLISKDKPGRSQELGSDSLSMNTGLPAVHRAIVEGLMCVEH
jgi:hypothetical protein